jgi:hypothetical protein
MDHRHITDQQQLLAEMAREGSANRRETSAVISSGAGTGAWAVRITSHVTHNVYIVRRVLIEEVGLPPTEVGEQMEAFNLAESFEGTGSLTSGAYAVMHRVGDKNVFSVTP